MSTAILFGRQRARAAAIVLGLAACLLGGGESLRATGPPVILEQPVSMTTFPGCQVAFSVEVYSALPVTYQWFRGGVEIPGATGSVYETPPAGFSDDGVCFHVVASNGAGWVTSSNACLTVVGDVSPPRLLRARGSASLDRVVIDFAEELPCVLPGGWLDPVTATDPSHYLLSGGLAVMWVELGPHGTNVMLGTSPQEAGAAYTVVVEGVGDVYGNLVESGSLASFRAWMFVRGLLQREVYAGLPGSGLSGLTGAASYPDWPDLVDYVSSFEVPRNVGEELGQRVSGFLYPPVSGDHRFYLAGDDHSALYLGGGISTGNLEEIIPEVGPLGVREWFPAGTVRSNQSAVLSLQGGGEYRVAVLLKEDHQADHVAVAWQVPLGQPPANGADVLPGTYLGSYAAPADALEVNSQPQTQVVEYGCRTWLHFGVRVQPADVPVAYQWQKDGLDIPGANGATYQTVPVSFVDMASYRCLAFAPGITVTSAVVSIIVLDVGSSVRLLGVVPRGPDRILAVFSGPVLPGSRLDYTLSPAGTVEAVAWFGSDSSVVELRLSESDPLAPGTSYVLTASGVRTANGWAYDPDPGVADFVAVPAMVPVAGQELRLTRAYAKLILEWGQGGFLQVASGPAGPWMELPQATSPYTVQTVGGCRVVPFDTLSFFRVRF